MRRRDFIAALGGAAAMPLAVRAQQPPVPVVGFLNGTTPARAVHHVAAFRQGLGETGHVEGQTVAIEYRWGENRSDRLPALAAELVRRPVAVIAATGGFGSAATAKAATTTIPIVFTLGGTDPVEIGLVASLNRPGGNVTGVMLLTLPLTAKRVELLRTLVPKAAVVAVLVDPAVVTASAQLKEARPAARALGLELIELGASTEDEIGVAFGRLAAHRADALFIGSSPLFETRRDQIVALAARYAIPTIYNWREYAAAGGLMSYGANITEMYRQAGIYTGTILKGAKPADLPVLQPTKFELVINLKTAKALGLEVPAQVLALADEVIE